MDLGEASRRLAADELDNGAGWMVGESGRRSFYPARPHQPDKAPGADLLQGVIDDLAEQIALVDASWTLLAVNKAWAEAPETHAIGPLGAGDNYLETCRLRGAEGDREALLILDALRQIDAGTRTSFEHVYAKPNKGREYRLVISCVHSGRTRFATIARYEITELMTLERRNRRLERSPIHIQQEEGRRIGRELHDATAQQLVALHLSMIQLKAMHRDAESSALFAEIDDTLNRVIEEIRAIAFLLHPPSLAEHGLVEALDAMSRGFARRTRLRTSFAFEGEPTSWDAIVEETIYRVAQEALANVHRHAAAEGVGILLTRRRGFLHLVIEDDGIGIAAGAAGFSLAPGVGVAGMRSRVEEQGGRFSIRPMESGTRVTASIPLPRGERPASGRRARPR